MNFALARDDAHAVNFTVLARGWNVGFERGGDSEDIAATPGGKLAGCHPVLKRTHAVE